MKSNPHYGSCTLAELLDIQRVLAQEISLRQAEGEVCHRTVCDERCGFPSCMGPEVSE